MANPPLVLASNPNPSATPMSAGATPSDCRNATDAASALELLRKSLPRMLVFSSVMPATLSGMSASSAGSADGAREADAAADELGLPEAPGTAGAFGDGVTVRVCAQRASARRRRPAVPADRMRVMRGLWFRLRQMRECLRGGRRIVGEDDEDEVLRRVDVLRVAAIRPGLDALPTHGLGGPGGHLRGHRRLQRAEQG